MMFELCYIVNITLYWYIELCGGGACVPTCMPYDGFAMSGDRHVRVQLVIAGDFRAPAAQRWTMAAGLCNRPVCKPDTTPVYPPHRISGSPGCPLACPSVFTARIHYQTIMKNTPGLNKYEVCHLLSKLYEWPRCFIQIYRRDYTNICHKLLGSLSPATAGS